MSSFRQRFIVTRALKIAALAVGLMCATYAERSYACDRPGISVDWTPRIRSIFEEWKKVSNHPLIGRIWAKPFSENRVWRGEGLLTHNGYCDMMPWEVLGFATFWPAIAIFGEVHDNPEHHKLRAALLDVAKFNDAAGGWPDGPAYKTSQYIWSKRGVVLEQFNASQQEGLKTFAELQTLGDSRALSYFKHFTDWEKSGWSKYAYDPLLQSLIDGTFPLQAGDVPREAVMKVAREGESALPEDERKRLKLDVPLGEKLDAASIDEIDEAHCHAMPKEALGGLAFAQRYRDATLADNVLTAVEKNGSAILFTGNNHVRTDRGVPWYIWNRAEDIKSDILGFASENNLEIVKKRNVISIMLIEVEDGQNDPESYVPRDPDGKPAADYIIFTPRAERKDDPCDKFKGK